MITINGVEFDIDLMDADTMERLEAAAEKVKKDVETEKAKGYTKSSEFIKAFCGVVDDFLDTVLDDSEAHTTIFGGRVNMVDHMKAYEGIFEAKRSAETEVQEFTEKYKNTYSPNRAARRAAAKKNGN